MFNDNVYEYKRILSNGGDICREAVVVVVI